MYLEKVPRDSADKIFLDAVNEEAFPENERCSLDDLYKSGKDGNLDMLGIYGSSGITGFLAVRRFGRIRYLAYFAVSSSLRSNGIGSKALRLLKEYYPGTQIVTEFETPVSGDDIKLRRRDFYLRNGFFETGWYSSYDGTEFTVACSEPDFDKEGFVRFTEYLSTIIPDFIPHLYRK